MRKYFVALGISLLAVGMAACLALIAHPASAVETLSQPASPTNCGPGWAVEPSANSGTAGNILNGVSALSSTEVWAVGAYSNTSGVSQTLIERWDGSAWNIVPSPNVGTSDNLLQAVSARTSSDVWAVGFYRTSSASPYQTLTLHWDGTQWSQATSASPGSAENYLYGVVTISATDAWAVGYYSNSTNIYQTLTERWNGTQWNVVSSPNPFLRVAGLRGVTAIAPNDVWAVGASADLSLNYYTYTLHWTGTSWSEVSSPNNGDCLLAAVANVAANNVWAVGACNDGTRFVPLSERWNGSAWAIIPTPSFGTGDNALGGLAVVSATDIWAVGGYDTGTELLTLAIHWDGANWTQGKSANPGLTDNSLVAASTAAGDLWAVGSYGDTSQQTLTERYGTIPCITPTAVPTGTATTVPVATSTATSPAATSTSLPTSIATNTAIVTVAVTTTPVPPTATGTVIAATPTGTPNVATSTATSVQATATSTACAISFSDVPNDHTFYSFIRCLACRGIISGYSDGTFRPGNEITRSQIAKMVSNAANINDDPGEQIYEDVDPTSTFYVWINRLSRRGYIGGYPCGTIPEEPCNPPDNRPYFRSFANATRGQLAKIVSNAAGLGGTPTGIFYTDVPEEHPFYLWIMRLTNLGVMSGYPCGAENEPCDDANRPYFRPFANVTRGQASKIVANTFYPNCQTP
ncbi:MAG TPA: S-layer homology domain-containing protein [Chloroflexia bacterium]|nr:S-layer homology domain-containing protein [Chloroflexia bacterium]